MPSQETLERFISRVEENAHADAVDEYYTDGATVRENQAPPRIGRANHAANERRILALASSVKSQCIRPVFLSGDYVVLRWVFIFDWPDGTVTEMEELAYQRWEGERIAAEQFFYDPAQRVPKKALLKNQNH